MNQKQLIVAAMQHQGLTSFYQLAQRLGVTDSRISQLRHQQRPADEAEIMMLADMAEIDPRIAFAAVHLEREKSPAKRAYWERIAAAFSMAIFAVTIAISAFPTDAQANSIVVQSTNYAKNFSRIRRSVRRLKNTLKRLLSELTGGVNAKIKIAKQK